MSKPTEESFLKDVATHEMKVIRDERHNRHVIFSRPKSFVNRFELITWEGHLCYTGDMGTFVFRRLEDMFEFFRDGREGKLRINPQYWSEKLEAVDRCDGDMEWSAEKFREVIESYLETDDDPLPEGLREAVDEQVLAYADEGQHEAYGHANDFEFNGFTFSDLWDHEFREYTYRFIWCCYALAWGIRQYDAKSMDSQPSGVRK